MDLPQADVLVECVVARSLLDAPEAAVELLLDADKRGALRSVTHAPCGSAQHDTCMQPAEALNDRDVPQSGDHERLVA